MHEYVIETDCLDIELVEPQIKYAEDIWNFRQEIIDINVNIKMYIFDHLKMYRFAYSSS